MVTIVTRFDLSTCAIFNDVNYPNSNLKVMPIFDAEYLSNSTGTDQRTNQCHTIAYTHCSTVSQYTADSSGWWYNVDVLICGRADILMCKRLELKHACNTCKRPQT